MTLLIQFLGFVFFLLLGLVGFWSLTFLIAVAHYWAIKGPIEFYGKSFKEDKEKYRKKYLFEQEGFRLLWKKENI